MGQEYKEAILIMCVVIMGVAVGFAFGYMHGQYRERSSFLVMLRKIRVTEMTPNTRLHILYVVDDIYRQLREAWRI